MSVCHISQLHELAGIDVFSEVYKMLGSLVCTVFFIHWCMSSGKWEEVNDFLK